MLLFIDHDVTDSPTASGRRGGRSPWPAARLSCSLRPRGVWNSRRRHLNEGRKAVRSTDCAQPAQGGLHPGATPPAARAWAYAPPRRAPALPILRCVRSSALAYNTSEHMHWRA